MGKVDKMVAVANGKLLLTGEYLVMDGATAIALPLNLGQTLSIEPSDDVYLTWKAFDVNGIWFEGCYSVPEFSLVSSTNRLIGETLQHILVTAATLNPHHRVTQGMFIKTCLNFNRLLGLGSSSTLIALIADLFDTDKYKLHARVSTGSGYDVACTAVDYPIFYTRKSKEEALVEPANFNPAFAHNLYFAYLGNKQDTNSEIVRYQNIEKGSLMNQVAAITEISRELSVIQDLTTFTSLIEEHEKIMSTVLNRNSIRQHKFSDFNGCVKSLGAWGGDFVLAASAMDETAVFNYFAKNNITTIFRFKDLVLNNKVINNHDTIIKF